MHDLIAALISIFRIGPFRGEIADLLAATRAPQEIVAQVTTCAGAAGPAMVERAIDDPWWATSSALAIWAGLAEPQAVLVEAAPGCAEAIATVQPFLEAES